METADAPGLPDGLLAMLQRAGFRQDCAACPRIVARGPEACPEHYRRPEDVDRLPAGVKLPNGTVIAYRAERACDCGTCRAAFTALESGKLIEPDDTELPW